MELHSGTSARLLSSVVAVVCQAAAKGRSSAAAGRGHPAAQQKHSNQPRQNDGRDRYQDAPTIQMCISPT
jgi:hypothetical protein